MTTYAFTDTETTHLEATHGHAWEIAVIRRDHDGTETEHLWQINVDLTNADPDSLRIGGYNDRYAVPAGTDAIQVMPDGGHWKLTLPEMLFDLQTAVSGAVLAGTNAGFDDRFLRKLMDTNGRKILWHYRTTCVSTIAEGYLWATQPDLMAQNTKPPSSRWLSQQVGVEPPAPGIAHTALGDARWARDVHNAVTSRTGHV